MADLDSYDAIQDERSEACYTDDPRAEPEIPEVLEHRDDLDFAYLLDDDAGFRG